MKVDFIKISPTQNITILVKTPVDRSKHIETANSLMDYDGVFAEQVGFIEKPLNPEAAFRVQMMGGEFCGNATMSAAAWHVFHDENSSDSQIIPVEVSGADDLLYCKVTKSGSSFRCKIKMPKPEKIEIKNFKLHDFDYTLPLVHMSGITHLIVPNGEIKEHRDSFIDGVFGKCSEFTNEEALGIIFLDVENISIVPIVYVIPTNSKVWERGCGSGSCAVGTYLTHQEKATKSIDVKQPGGTITVEVIRNGGVLEEIWIEGNVRIIAEGIAYI